MHLDEGPGDILIFLTGPPFLPTACSCCLLLFSWLPQVHSEEGPGDILIFLTGQEEIESCERLITERGAALAPQLTSPAGGKRLSSTEGGAALAQQLKPPAAAPGGGVGVAAEAGEGGGSAGGGGGAGGHHPSGLLVLPIYASLPPEQQLKVFQPALPGIRKVGRGGVGGVGGMDTLYSLAWLHACLHRQNCLLARCPLLLWTQLNAAIVATAHPSHHPPACPPSIRGPSWPAAPFLTYLPQIILSTSIAETSITISGVHKTLKLFPCLPFLSSPTADHYFHQHR